MFRKILIANRGEIACRVVATARRMGIATVAVYSDADAAAKHVVMADEAVWIGPAPAAESYLQGDRIIEAALRTGAEAIHPGYGFLSENADFVDAVVAAGLTFIGPSAAAIQAMGLKDAAKALMVGAGVPVVPGYHGADQDPDVLAAAAGKIGYPVLIKARAGGGGKGMRLVETPGDFRGALDAARREGLSSFGDPACLIEKYVTRSRHIEIQVFGDNHGNVIHLFERDCSLQRRHQKVIEEAPAPGMTDDLRAAMGRAAVDAARAIGYSGAGTVEFIVDASGPLRVDGFWFMEMNTRLQVEHPVSEAITGFDFVELQLRLAAGEPLPIRQEDLKIDGWAVEARLYAEDVSNGFLPATGRLDHLRIPEAAEFAVGLVRIDSGVRQGDEITPWYDPMIAKVIAHGPTRTAALTMLGAALEKCQITGAVTNLDFLTRLVRHEGFGSGKVDTGLIDRDLDALVSDSAPPDHVVALAAVGGLGLLQAPLGDDPWDTLTGWRHWFDAVRHIVLEVAGRRVEMSVAGPAKGLYRVEFGTACVDIGVVSLDDTGLRIDLGDRQVTADVIRSSTEITVFSGGHGHTFGLPDALAEAVPDEAVGDTVVAPMTGLVGMVLTAKGAQVSAGEPLLILEAMKMEHTLVAPRDGVVAEVIAATGDQVAHGALLLRLEPQDG